MIKHIGKDWKVIAKSGRNMGTYPSKSQAQVRLKQIEMFKHMRKK